MPNKLIPLSPISNAPPFRSLTALPILIALVSPVLTRVCVFVVESLREPIVSGGKESAQAGTDPIDPVVAWERTRCYTGAEGAGGV